MLLFPKERKLMANWKNLDTLNQLYGRNGGIRAAIRHHRA